ncbi:LamB/YcsF family protein [Paenibacillus sp. YIM B09110]|uniref:LamB/YcsF family protein n=1 Tax=Paenibacillus sp. YIM B09110 TaxID=3126102 RepID=UPI00301D59C6
MNDRLDSTTGSAAVKAVDLNCDFGEGFGAYSFGQDDELLRYVTSVNIACGFHAGDPHTMRLAAEKSLAAGVAIGAHPGLPDRIGFGRREMSITASEAYDYVVYQVGALSAFVQAAGGRLSHVKPHGALYHMAGRDQEIAAAVVKAAADIDKRLLIFGGSGSLLLNEARRQGLGAVSEVFADRTYLADGTLTPRSQPGALLASTEAAVRQAVSMATEGKAYTASGDEIPIEAGTICLHGDGPHAAAFAQSISSALLVAGIALRAPQ